jgi:hypothetical protein
VGYLAAADCWLVLKVLQEGADVMVTSRSSLTPPVWLSCTCPV